MTKAKFVQRAETVDFIPDRDIDSGEIIRLGKLLGVTKLQVKAGELGALSLSGIYDVAKVSGAIQAGSKVYWDDIAQLATVTENGNSFLGIAACHSSPNAAKARIILNFGHPNTTEGGSSEGIQWQTIN